MAWAIMPKTASSPKARHASSEGASSALEQLPNVSSTSSSDGKKRQLARPAYRSFRISKRLRHKRPKVAGSFRLLKRSIATLFKRKRLFFSIVLVYLVLTIVLVKGFGLTSNISELRDTIDELLGGNFSKFLSGVTLFGVLLSNISATSGGQASSYQLILLVTVSLAFIWALRHTLSPESKKQKLTVRDAFYDGEYPLVPFLLVLLVIGLQLLPTVVASFLYSITISGGLAVAMIEKVLWIIIISLLVLLSLYMVTSSIFALYIVTLPGVRPMQALRSARELVRYRRGSIMRKLLFLPVALLVISAIIVIPVILVSPVAAEWLFFVLSMIGLAVIHSYLYILYRELL